MGTDIKRQVVSVQLISINGYFAVEKLLASHNNFRFKHISSGSGVWSRG